MDRVFPSSDRFAPAATHGPLWLRDRALQALAGAAVDLGDATLFVPAISVRAFCAGASALGFRLRPALGAVTVGTREEGRLGKIFTAYEPSPLRVMGVYGCVTMTRSGDEAEYYLYGDAVTVRGLQEYCYGVLGGDTERTALFVSAVVRAWLSLPERRVQAFGGQMPSPRMPK